MIASQDLSVIMEKLSRDTRYGLEENVREVFSVFEKFIEICNSDYWPNNLCTSEEITKAFTIAHFVEKCIRKLNERSIFDQFSKAFKKWIEASHQKPMEISKDILSKAANCILEKFLVSDLTSNVADIAITTYLNTFGEERLQNVLKYLILNAASCNTVENYANRCTLDIETENKLQSEIFLHSLSNKLDSQNVFVNKMMRADENGFGNLQILLRGLVCETSDYSETKNIIEQCLLQKMMERSRSNADFWFYVLQNFDKNSLYNLCKMFKNIYKEVILFLVHCSGHVQLDKSIISETIWITDRSTSLCPDLTYSHLKSIVQCFTEKTADMRDYLVTLVNDSFSNTAFWESIFKDCGVDIQMLCNNLDSFYDEDIFFD